MEAHVILVLLASTTGAGECLAVATRLAKTTGQSIQLTHVEVGPRAIVLPSQEQLSEYEAEHFAERERDQTEAIRNLVASWNADAHTSLPLDVFKGDEWRVMRHYRGHVGMVVLASPHTQPVGHRETLRAALLRTGHPVVMVPPGWKGGLGKRLMVGWSDQAPVHRAIKAFTPFLAAAPEVDVVAVGQDPAVLEPARKLITPIAAHATYRLVAPEGQRTAYVLLDAARARHADGLVAGAFRRGEILNWLIPGTSSRLIHESFLPLMMSA